MVGTRVCGVGCCALCEPDCGWVGGDRHCVMCAHMHGGQDVVTLTCALTMLGTHELAIWDVESPSLHQAWSKSVASIFERERISNLACGEVAHGQSQTENNAARFGIREECGGFNCIWSGVLFLAIRL